MRRNKPILCVDFDGVLHSYVSGWKGIANVADPPNAGAMRFLRKAVVSFDVHVFSTRSRSWRGRRAMKRWLWRWLVHETCDPVGGDDAFLQIKFPKHKPAAFITLDDRAVCFDGRWPRISELRDFVTWRLRKPKIIFH